ncbi:MAG: GntR family transcriptional regulator [Azospirillaceae bacterium]|nr:GntR family transcriptional regulator [Azospirillaceae bacterium]
MDTVQEDEAGAGTRRRSAVIHETLEEEIATGVIMPGSHLDETELAARFGASRTPVREALQQLAAAGMVEIRPRRGAIVPQPDPHVILEMFETMAEMEGVCAALAARRLTAEDKAALTTAHSLCCGEKAADPDEYYRRNESFHLALYRASHNRFLEEQTTALLRRLRPYRRLQLRLPNRVKSSRAEHGALLEAIFAHEGERAAAIARDHVQVQSHGFGDFLALLRDTTGAGRR